MPPNIRMRRTYSQRAARRNRRRVVRGRGIGSTIKKVISNPAVRAIAKKSFEYAPGIYKGITRRVKNKTALKVLNSDLSHLALSQAIKAGNRLLDTKPPIGLS